MLLQIFATSQHLSDVLITDSESYDLLRMTEGQPVAREELVAEFAAEVGAWPTTNRRSMTALRRFKRRETLARSAYGDIDSRPAARHGRAADFVLGRRHGRGRRAGRADANWPAEAQRARRPAAEAGPVRRAGPGQAGRRRAELFQRHRPDVLVRCRPRRRLARTASLQRVLRPRWPANVLQAAHRSDRAGRPPIASICDCARRPERPDGHQHRTRPALLRRVGPHLGTPGVRQGPAGGRRSGTGPRVPRPRSSPGSIAAI